MTFGLIKIHTGHRFEVDTSTDRGKFDMTLEFADVYDKSMIQKANDVMSKITVDDMIELFNKVSKR